MTEATDKRDFFISFNSADLAYAEAIHAALSVEGFTTFYHPRDLGPGGNIPMWMDEALMGSAQTLALYSPDYTRDKAVYSKAERYATWWQDPSGDKRKLIPVLLRETKFTPLMAMISRIEVMSMRPDEAAAHVIKRLKAPEEAKQSDIWRRGLPLPKIFRAAYRPNPNFTGRFEALESLQNSLREGTNAAVTAVAGMGGIGKTTLAAEYCHRFGGRYGGVWWVRAEQEPTMLADLQALAEKLGIAKGENTEVDARAALDHLASQTRPWLLVYDNAPNPDAVRDWLPQGAARAIITSRFTEFGGLATVTKLDQWSDEVTAGYLLSRTGRNDEDGAFRLAKQLGGLPLAAEQAARYLTSRSTISFYEYTNDIEKLIKKPKPKGAKGEYSDTAYAAFVKSLETVESMEAGAAALDLLRLCAFLSPDGVDLSLLTAERSHKYLSDSLAAALADKHACADALAPLASLSLLQRTDGPVGEILVFHRLLLDVVRDWMGEVARTRWGGAALQLVGGAFPNNIATNPSSWPICALLLPHVAPLETHAPQTGEAGRALGRLLNQTSLYLQARGDRIGALVLAKGTVALFRKTQAEEPLALATGLNNLGRRYADFHRLDEAEEAVNEALEIADAHLPAGDPRLAVWTSNLAEVHLRRKDFAKAEPLILRAAEIMKSAHGAESAEYGTLLSNLGALYGDWAEMPGEAVRRAQAEQITKKELSNCRAARGPRHPDTATSHNNLAVLMNRKGEGPGAAAHMERSVAIMLSLDLAQHPETQSDAAHLAHMWEQSGQPEKATRLRAGDIADMLPVIAEIETEHRAWVAQDPETRDFGPPPPDPYEAPFIAPEPDMAQMVEKLAGAAGLTPEELLEKIQSGEIDEAAFEALTAKLDPS